MTKEFTVNGFIKFCEGQPPFRQIDYVKSAICPLSLYAETLGYMNTLRFQARGAWCRAAGSTVISPWWQLVEHSAIAKKVDIVLSKLSNTATYADAVKVLKEKF